MFLEKLRPRWLMQIIISVPFLKKLHEKTFAKAVAEFGITEETVAEYTESLDHSLEEESHSGYLQRWSDRYLSSGRV